MTLEDPRKTLRAELRARRKALVASERIAAANGVAGTLDQLADFLVDPRIRRMRQHLAPRLVRPHPVAHRSHRLAPRPASPRAHAMQMRFENRTPLLAGIRADGATFATFPETKSLQWL